MSIEIKNMQLKDWTVVTNIYQLGIETDNATFETETPSWSTWNDTHMQSCRLTAWLERTIVGWAALSPVSDRCVYGGVAEVSVYVDTNYNGKGIGTKLLQELINQSEKEGFWTLQSGIFPENLASLLLHKKLGFREIGFRKKIGKTKNGIWRDNIILERRSKIVGIN